MWMNAFVAVEEAVPPGQQVALEPPLHLVLAEHLHHAAVRRDALVGGPDLGHRRPVGGLEDGVPAVGGRLVGTEDPEVPDVAIQLHHVPQEEALHPGGLGDDDPRRRHRDRVGAKVRHPKIAEQGAAVGVRVRAHSPVAPRRQFGQLRPQATGVVEQLPGTIAQHPLLEQPHVVGLVEELGQRHLVRPPAALDGLAVHFPGAGPALGRAQHDHRPARAAGPVEAVRARVGLDPRDLVEHGVERGGQLLVHALRIVAGDEVRRVAVAAEELVKLVVADAREYRGPGDLVPVEVQDRQHGAVVDRVQELVGVPARGQRPRLGLAVADHAGDQQVGLSRAAPYACDSA